MIFPIQELQVQPPAKLKHKCTHLQRLFVPFEAGRTGRVQKKRPADIKPAERLWQCCYIIKNFTM